MARTCPYCHAALDVDACFCGSCGKAVKAIETSVSEPPVQFAREGKSFVVRLRRPAAFCAGRRSPIEIVFQAHEDVFSSVSFQLLCADREIAARALRSRPGTVENRVLLQVTPQAPGSAALELLISLVADGTSAAEEHAAHFVISVDEPPTRQTMFNFAPQLVSDRAGLNEVGTINLNVANGAFATAPVDVARYETLLDAEVVPTDLLQSPTRLTLRAADGRTIQLLSEEEITFGRNRENIVISRIFGADGKLDLPANKGNLSRFHFKIVRCRDGARIVDVGSVNGTRLDGEDVSTVEGLRLPVNRTSVLAAGRADAAFVYEVMPQAGAWQALAGFVLMRRDHMPEQVVVSWGGRVLLEDGAFQFDGGRWMFVSASGASADLSLASRVNVGGTVFHVMSHHQPFV